MTKKTINLLAISIVILTIAFVYTKKNKPLEEKVFTNNISVDGQNMVAGDFSNADTYQQDLLKTIAEQNVLAFEKVAESFKKTPDDTLSQSVAKDVFGQYLQYNTTGALDVEAVKNSIQANIQSQKPDIKLTSPKAITVIGSSLANLQKYTDDISQTQYIISKKIASITNRKNPEKYIQGIYAVSAKLFTNIAVPEDLAKDHLQMINGFEYYAQGFALMEKQSTDPAIALFGVQIAQKGNSDMVEALTNIRKIINLNNIVYNKKDKAYMWLLEQADNEKIKTQ